MISEEELAAAIVASDDIAGLLAQVSLASQRQLAGELVTRKRQPLPGSVLPRHHHILAPTPSAAREAVESVHLSTIGHRRRPPPPSMESSHLHSRPKLMAPTPFSPDSRDSSPSVHPQSFPPPLQSKHISPFEYNYYHGSGGVPAVGNSVRRTQALRPPVTSPLLKGPELSFSHDSVSPAQGSGDEVKLQLPKAVEDPQRSKPLNDSPVLVNSENPSPASATPAASPKQSTPKAAKFPLHNESISGYEGGCEATGTRGASPDASFSNAEVPSVTELHLAAAKKNNQRSSSAPSNREKSSSSAKKHEILTPQPTLTPLHPSASTQTQDALGSSQPVAIEVPVLAVAASPAPFVRTSTPETSSFGPYSNLIGTDPFDKSQSRLNESRRREQHYLKLVASPSLDPRHPNNSSSHHNQSGTAVLTDHIYTKDMFGYAPQPNVGIAQPTSLPQPAAATIEDHPDRRHHRQHSEGTSQKQPKHDQVPSTEANKPTSPVVSFRRTLEEVAPEGDVQNKRAKTPPPRTDVEPSSRKRSHSPNDAPKTEIQKEVAPFPVEPAPLILEATVSAPLPKSVPPVSAVKAKAPAPSSKPKGAPISPATTKKASAKASNKTMVPKPGGKSVSPPVDAIVAEKDDETQGNRGDASLNEKESLNDAKAAKSEHHQRHKGRRHSPSSSSASNTTASSYSSSQSDSRSSYTDESVSSSTEERSPPPPPHPLRKHLHRHHHHHHGRHHANPTNQQAAPVNAAVISRPVSWHVSPGRVYHTQSGAAFVAKEDLDFNKGDGFEDPALPLPKPSVNTWAKLRSTSALPFHRAQTAVVPPRSSLIPQPDFFTKAGITKMKAITQMMALQKAAQGGKVVMHPVPTVVPPPAVSPAWVALQKRLAAAKTPASAPQIVQAFLTPRTSLVSSPGLSPSASKAPPTYPGLATQPMIMVPARKTAVAIVPEHSGRPSSPHGPPPSGVKPPPPPPSDYSQLSRSVSPAQRFPIKLPSGRESPHGVPPKGIVPPPPRPSDLSHVPRSTSPVAVATTRPYVVAPSTQPQQPVGQSVPRRMLPKPQSNDAGNPVIGFAQPIVAGGPSMLSHATAFVHPPPQSLYAKSQK